MARRRNRGAAREKSAFEAVAGMIIVVVGVLMVPQFREAIWSVLAPVLFVAVLVALVGGLVGGLVLWIRRQDRCDSAEITGRVFRDDLTQVFPLPPSAASAAIVAPRLSKAPLPIVEKPLADRLREIDWFQFEKLVAALYRTRGYAVTRRGGAHPDGGVDLVVVKAGETTVVQCKHWQNALVKPDKVRELIGAQTIERAQRSVLVTLRGYTTAALQLAREQRVELIAETQLVAWLGELRFSPDWPEIERALDATDKSCPRCEAPLLERIAKSGTNASGRFWGCSTYPRCDFTFAG
ncbi:MAG: restriction endonuclease [Verrucomicrobiota bacterium]